MTQADHDRRVDYIEFGATDIGRTKQFYQQVFGWRFEDYGPEYTSFQDGPLSGGVYQHHPARPPTPPAEVYTPPHPAAAGKNKHAGEGSRPEDYPPSCGRPL